jgi:isopentenyldiphosphate isomerase
MKKLRTQIRATFFDPILHLLPLLLFLVLDDIYGMNLAWRITFPVALSLVVYIFYKRNEAFNWHLIFAFMFMGVGLLGSILSLFPLTTCFFLLKTKLVVIFFLLIYFATQKKMRNLIMRFIPKVIPMSNNFNELYRSFSFLFIILLGYVVLYLIFDNIIFENSIQYIPLLQSIFIGVIVFFVCYEIIRVQLIRAKLVQEEWWPIVSEQGKIIGNIQHLTSLLDEQKYLHPIARVLEIDKSMVLLKKRPSDDLIFPNLWDTVISSHVRMGENIDKCIERAVYEQYNIKEFKYLFLSNYVNEIKNESHYAFLFVSCTKIDVASDQTKWWTQQQIEENLNAGIFSENFILEFDLLKRSGLLESGKCECTCKLKDVIYQQTEVGKKD